MALCWGQRMSVEDYWRLDSLFSIQRMLWNNLLQLWNSKKNHHAPLVHRVTLYQHMYSSAMCTLTKRKQRCCHFITFYRSINTPFSPSYTRQAMSISVETFEMTLRPCKMMIQITQETPKWRLIFLRIFADHYWCMIFGYSTLKTRTHKSLYIHSPE